MNSITKVAVTLTLFLASCSMAMAQSSSGDKEFAAKLNRLNGRLSIANTAVKTNFSELELTEEQKQMLVDLRQRHQLVISEVRQFRRDESGQAKLFLLEKITELENDLSSNILLPHQVDQINQMHFKRQLNAFGGNLVQMMLVSYRDQLELTDSQALKLQKLSEETQEKIAAARDRFKKELEEIEASSKTDLQSSLTPKQFSVLTQARGKSPEAMSKE